mmetsp:Transcript_9231/g.25840  ORF Transcript_9231/g.25840 Transcript_9231/m.25840 type:complete len:222 (-) Transcript_9231:450-1115(-)
MLLRAWGQRAWPGSLFEPRAVCTSSCSTHRHLLDGQVVDTFGLVDHSGRVFGDNASNNRAGGPADEPNTGNERWIYGHGLPWNGHGHVGAHAAGAAEPGLRGGPQPGLEANVGGAARGPSGGAHEGVREGASGVDGRGADAGADPETAGPAAGGDVALQLDLGVGCPSVGGHAGTNTGAQTTVVGGGPHPGPAVQLEDGDLLALQEGLLRERECVLLGAWG